MSRTDTWMPLYIGDYMADTMHLSGAEHGAYLLLLMHSWRTGPLPDDGRTLANIARTDTAAWKRVGPVVMAFFERTPAGLVSPRLEREREKALANTDQRIAAGKAGAAKRWGRGGGEGGEGNSGGSASHGEQDGGGNATANGKRNATAMPSPMANAWQNDGPSPSPSEIPPSQPSAVRSPRGCRLPDGWLPTDDDRAFASQLGLDADAVAAQFRDYWRAKAGKDAAKLDWSATWRGWCRRDADSPGRRNAAPAKPSRFGFLADAMFGPEGQPSPVIDSTAERVA